MRRLSHSCKLLEWEQRIRMCILPSDFGGPALPLGPLTQAHCAEGGGCTAIGSLSSMRDPRDAGGEVHGAAALPGPQEDPCLGGTNQTVLAPWSLAPRHRLHWSPRALAGLAPTSLEEKSCSLGPSQHLQASPRPQATWPAHSSQPPSG